MSVALRPRSHWEAMDLGFAMARHWFLPLWLLWLALAFPVYLLAELSLGGEPIWVGLICWWLKPLYEPPLTYWSSRMLFGERLGIRQVLGAWRSSILPGLLYNLTLGRLSLNRSARMPIRLLEGLTGARRKDRVGVLERRASGAGWLTIVAYHVETILWFSLMMLLLVLVPEETRWVELDSLMAGQTRVEQIIQQLGYLLAMSLVAPFYVVGGFALYLSRRTELEAWDLELRFRRLAEERTATPSSDSKRAPGAITATLLALTLCLGTLAPPSAQAVIVDPDRVQGQIIQVLDDADFGEPEQIPYWKFVGERDRDTEPNFFSPLLRWLARVIEGFFDGFAHFGELLLWLGILALGVIAGTWLYRNRQWLQQYRGLGRWRPRRPPVQLFGLELTPESLPSDIAGEALRLLAAGDPRAALSLLYRGALSRFLHQHQIDIRDSATENECLALTKPAVTQPEYQLFQRLTGDWIRLAYGHQLPPRQRIDELCEQWRQVFDHRLETLGT